MTMANGHANGTGAMVHAPQRADLSVRFTPAQHQVILDTCCGGASLAEAKVLIAIAEARGLNPILQECYFVKRYDSAAGREKWAVQAAIDSFRIKAEQTGLYAGQDEPEFEYDAEGLVVLARVRVYRKDWPRPAVGVARWSEYVQTTKNGDPTKFWRQMPHNQLAKCAEALALRKAFPAVLSKIYVTEEMEQADNVVSAPAQMEAPRPVQALPVSTDPRAFADLCDRVDSAETMAALNAIAKDALLSAKAGTISKGNLDVIKEAVTRKRGLVGKTPEPPPSEAANVDPNSDREIGEEG